MEYEAPMQRRPSVTRSRSIFDRRPSDRSNAPSMDRRHSLHKHRKGPSPQVTVKNFLLEVESTILRAWLKIFDPEYKFHITSDQFYMGMEKAGYAGDVYLLFQRLDADNSGKLTLDEIDEDTAKLWLAFKSWCVATFESPLDMVYRLSRGKDYLSEEDFKLRCRLFDWKDGQEDVLWKGVALRDEEYVRPEMLKWMAVGKEEHREKEELKKLAMKVHAAKIRERQMLAQALPQFKVFLKRKCGGSLLAAWRRHLDRHASMSVHKYEMAKAAKALCWPGEFRILWKALDKDKSGLVSYQELDMPGAEVLAEFKSFVTAKFGSAENAFNAMDKAKSNSGRLSERDFLEECQKNGFTATRALFRGLDFHATGSITRDEILFLDQWVSPSYLTAPKNEAAAQEFKQRLKRMYKSTLKAWRTCLDKDNSNRVTWERFQEGANRVFFHNDLPGAWRYLTAGSTYLTLHDVDPETAERISHFQAFADEQFGSMMCAYKLFDLDKNGYVDVTEFTRVLIGFGYPGGQCKALFYCLDVDGHGRLSRRNVSFIDDWTRPREETWEEISEKPDEKKTTQKEKEVELSPRMLELATPKKPREEPKPLGKRAVRDLRIAELRDEIMTRSDAVDRYDPEDQDSDDDSSTYDYEKMRLKNLSLRYRTIHLLQRSEDLQDQEKVKLPTLKLQKAPPQALLKKTKSPYDIA